MKNTLLCTFAHKSDLDLIIDFIKLSYDLKSKRIYVFKNKEKQDQYYCTYNIMGEYTLHSNTIIIHRKSESSTLYTINALNKIIERMNNGILDKTIELNWEAYTNILILYQNDKIIEIPLELVKVEKV